MEEKSLFFLVDEEKSLIITVSLGPTLAHFGLSTVAPSAISSFGPRNILFSSLDKEFGLGRVSKQP